MTPSFLLWHYQSSCSYFLIFIHFQIEPDIIINFFYSQLLLNYFLVPHSHFWASTALYLLIALLIKIAQFFIRVHLWFFSIEFLGFPIESSEIAWHYLNEGMSSVRIIILISVIHTSWLAQFRKWHHGV